VVTRNLPMHVQRAGRPTNSNNERCMDSTEAPTGALGCFCGQRPPAELVPTPSLASLGCEWQTTFTRPGYM
jgi:hypothetical protein